MASSCHCVAFYHLRVLASLSEPVSCVLAASGQLPEGVHFVPTLSGVAKDALPGHSAAFAARLACLSASLHAAVGDLQQVQPCSAAAAVPM